MPRRYVETRWGQVHIRDTATPGPAIVLLHESPLSSAVYEPVLPGLGLRLRAVAPDTPGYGASDGPDGEAEISDYAATLLEAIDAVGLERFAVAGVHTGASLAIQLAVQAPERVTHAILSGVPLFEPEVRQRYLDTWAPPVRVAADGSHLTWAWERYERIWGGPPELLHLGATTLLSNLEGYHHAYQAAFRYDPEPDLAAVSCPVLLYTAARDLLIEADELAVERFPEARLEPVPSLRGQIPLRDPEAYVARVQRFVLEGR